VSQAHRSARRITGLETEYGCMVGNLGSRAVAHVRDWIFEQHRLGLVDRHDRGWDEPPGNGGFLYNGGRVYIDMGHIEYCTAECATVADVVRYDRAGDRILLAAVDALGLGEKVSFFRNNIDHHSGATFGCHENYSLLRAAPLTEKNVLSLLAFLTVRLLFTGSGRVGGAKFPPGEPMKTVPFQISQRADYIENDFYEWVQHNRAIINTRDEPLADPRKYRRLHLLHGDTHVLPSALYLKIGATRLVLDLLEADELPDLVLEDAVGTLRALSHQPVPPWRVAVQGRGSMDAVELLGEFRRRAQKLFSGRDAETDAVLALWSRVERGLANDLKSVVGLVDWVTKHHLLETFRESEKLEWNDPWLEAQDLEYHHIDPARSLGLALADLDGPWAVGLDDPAAMEQPPRDTRASLRSQALRELATGEEYYEIDWERVQRTEGESIMMLDPFQTTPGKET
jgi:proteasome accessory factor A